MLGLESAKGLDASGPGQARRRWLETVDAVESPLLVVGEDSRILAVADVVEAMSSHRPYRPGLGLGLDAALNEIQEKKGIWFEPQVVDTCLRLFREKRFEFEMS